MNEAIQELASRLKQLGCQYVDRYNQETLTHAHDWPAAFIELGKTVWKPRRGTYISGLGTVSIHLVQQQLGDSYTLPNVQKTDKLSFDLVDSLIKGLSNWKPQYFKCLELAELQPATKWNQFVSDKITFRMEVVLPCEYT